MRTKKAHASKKAAKKKYGEIPYVLKDKYLQVTIEGKPFSLDSTHPTFNKMAKALRDKNWKAVPRLVTVAQSLFSASAGNVQIKNGIVHYKGSPVDDSLARYIVEMIKNKQEVNHMLLFMDNLFQNPSPEARDEFFDWFRTSNLPITDDGCILAYKALDSNLRDTHTGTVDNSPGRIITGSRKWFNENYRTQCAAGFHVCSKEYGLYGSRVMAVKVNPRDILSANAGKMRCVNYETLYELGQKDELTFKAEGFSDLEKKILVEFQGERKELLKLILAAPQIKRAIRDKKLSETTIKKAAHTRLKAIAQRYELVQTEPVSRKIKSATIGKGEGKSGETVSITQGEVVSLATLPILQQARKAAGFTIGQVAKQMGLNYKAVAALEKADPRYTNQARHDAFIEAIWVLKGHSKESLSRGAVSFPKPKDVKAA